MKNIPDIIAAMAALTKVLPGAGSYTSINIHNCDDSAIAAFVEAGGSLGRCANEQRTEEWDIVDFCHDGLRITAFGPHRKIERTAVDQAAAADALARAQAVLL